ncbi:hypothetical protein ACJMK2_027372 [Sinanodonta woodiana]|uniref:Ig-like domain-containing protein n=1 Tax=Sinanodonta woodiana TaxID=1069815 RepID=A0ABD3XP30_SINWO
MGNYRNVIFILAVWFKCYDCQDSVSIQPSPVVQAYEGDSLTLTCKYTGPNSPLTVKWYINNVASDMSVWISTCSMLGTTVPDYEISRYRFSCSNPYTLKISQTSFADDGDVWGCSVGILGFPPPPVSQTTMSITKRGYRA